MNEAIDTPRRGRPPKDEAPLKRGHPTWKPANVDETINKEAGFSYRWINEDAANVSKKQMEHWEVLSDTAGSKTKSEVGYGRIDDGAQLTSVRRRVGQILARMPEDMAKSRADYVNARTERGMNALRRQTKQELGDAPLHGSITMEKKGIRNIIKE